MTSPICLVNGLATTNGVDVTPGTLVTIQLADTAGVNTWEITCIGTDDLLTTDDINDTLTIIDVTAKTATFTMPNDDGYSVILQSRVNRGVDVNGRAVSSYTTTFKVATLINLNRTIAVNETTESDAVFGWAKPVNEIIRYALSSHLALGGDISGTYPTATVEAVKGTTIGTAGGALTTGRYLRTTGASSCDWEQLILSITGDVSCTITDTTGSSTVNKVKGTTIGTAGGSLPDGYVLRTTGTDTADWGKVDLANTNSITGTLPLVNRPLAVYAAAVLDNPISITGGAGSAKLNIVSSSNNLSNGMTISTSNDNITVATAGTYKITSTFKITNSSGLNTSFEVEFFNNGTSFISLGVGQFDGSSLFVFNGETKLIVFEQIVSLAASDVIDVRVNSVQTVSIQGGSLRMNLL